MLKLMADRGAERCHWLHYLQMTSEKLAKAYLTPPGGSPPMSHEMLVRLVRFLSKTPRLRRRLGLASTARANAYAVGLLPVAERVQGLAPSAAHRSARNPEYPWQPQPDADVVAPADYPFHSFERDKTNLPRLLRLIAALLESEGIDS